MDSFIPVIGLPLHVHSVHVLLTLWCFHGGWRFTFWTFHSRFPLAFSMLNKNGQTHMEDRERFNHGYVKGHPSNQRQIWEQNIDIRNLSSEGILINKPAVHVKERKKHVTDLELKPSSFNILLFNWLEEGTDTNWPKLGKPRSRWKNIDYPIPPSTHQILETLPGNLHFNRRSGDSVKQLCFSPCVYVTKKVT